MTDKSKKEILVKKDIYITEPFQKIFALDTYFSLYESNKDGIKRVFSNNYNIDNNGKEHLEASVIATSFNPDSEINDIDRFEMAMNAIKRALNQEFNYLVEKFRKEKFPEAKEKILKSMELFENESIDKIDKENEELRSQGNLVASNI